MNTQLVRKSIEGVYCTFEGETSSWNSTWLGRCTQYYHN